MGTSKRLPVGVTERRPGANLQITFTFNGVLCKETLKGYKNNRAGVQYAASLLSEIQRKITAETFRYADYFPKSNKCKLFGEAQSKATVDFFLRQYIELANKRKLAFSTVRGYEICARRLKPLWNIPAVDLNPAILKNFIVEISGTTKNKTIRNTMSVLSNAMALAVADMCVSRNVVKEMNWSSLVEHDQEKAPIEPFEPDEIHRIIKAQRFPEVRNLVQLLFYTGLRPSEAFALKWSDIDLVREEISVSKATVMGHRKEKTKTKHGKRIIQISRMKDNMRPYAIGALKAQRELTQLSSEFVFISPITGKTFFDDQSLRKVFWAPSLKRASIRYRRPYNMRHTFACMMISNNENLWWLCEQMGHADPTMLFRNYGSYMKEHEMIKEPKSKQGYK